MGIHIVIITSSHHLIGCVQAYLRCSAVFSMPAFSRRLPIVPVDSSDANKPFPGVASCVASSCNVGAVIIDDDPDGF